MLVSISNFKSKILIENGIKVFWWGRFDFLGNIDSGLDIKAEVLKAAIGIDLSYNYAFFAIWGNRRNRPQQVVGYAVRKCQCNTK